MKICPRCKKEHNKKRGLYCSRSCANVREYTEELKQRRSIDQSNFLKTKQGKQQKIKMEEKHLEYFDKVREELPIYSDDPIFTGIFTYDDYED